MTIDFSAERAAYNVLKKVFCEKAYSSIELDRVLDTSPEQVRGKITALVYGVLEKSVQLDYIISVLAKNKVKSNIEILIKMGLYESIYGSDPEYAVVDRYVSFAKNRFFGSQGFVNAVLRRAKDVAIPTGNDNKSLSVRYSQPLWLVEKLIAAYGLQRAVDLMSTEMVKLTHIRYNSLKITKAEFDSKIIEIGQNESFLQSKLGYYVTHSILSRLGSRLFTPQSIASMYAVNIYAESFISSSPDVLDLCAAPGGKSIYFKELVPNASIIACDIHEHRVGLIKSYASRMTADMKIEINDATKLRTEWVDKFDAVICDVPCSGSGLLVSSPDILLFKGNDDIRALSEIQFSILSTAANYVKIGGELIYSTCSILKEENENIIERFLNGQNGFESVSSSLPYGVTLDGMTKLMPDKDGCDGFFIAKMRRLK